MSSGEAGAQRGAGRGGLLVLVIGAAAFSLAQTTVVPALQALERGLHTSAGNVSWVLSGYLVAASIMTPVVGRLGDMFGKRLMLAIVMGVFAVGGVVAALASNVWVVVAARAVQGVGGGVFPLCFGIINDTYPPRRRAGALGFVAAISGIGAGGGLIMGGLLVDHASWRWLFWCVAIMAAIPAVGTVFLPESGKRTPGRVDVVGALLLAVGLTAPLIGLTETTRWGWADARTLGLFAAGVVVLTLFVLVERRVAEPLMDMRLAGRPAVLATNLTTLLIGFGMFGAFVLLPQIAETPRSSGYGFGMDATGAGLLLLPACLVMLVTGGVSGRIGQRFGQSVPLVVGMVISAAGLAALALEHGSPGAVLGLAVLVFVGVGFGVAAVPTLIVEAVPPETTGQSTGVNALVRSVGSSLGSQVAATVLAGSVTASNALPTDGSFTEALWIGTGGLVCAAVVAALIPRRRTPTNTTPTTEQPSGTDQPVARTATPHGDQAS